MLTHEHEGLRLKIRKGASGTLVPVLSGTPATSPPAPSSASAAASEVAQTGPTPAPSASPAAAGEVELAVVKSPIVGTFYRSAEPEAPSFVDIGTMVKKGQVLCIIEAMKLMNEINSEIDGEIVKVYVENGQAVQYGERLFAIRPA